MSLSEQTAWGGRPPTLRASRPSATQKQSVGHQAGLHPEDAPHHTTQGQTRTPARIVYKDDRDDDVYTERRMPTVVKKYTGAAVPTRTRVSEEPLRTRITPLRFFLIALGIILAAFVLAALITTLLMPALNRWNDDRTYGYPRTIHARANIGHGTTGQPYSDFTGENIDGYIYVFELQETDPSQQHPQAYFVGRYSGSDKDLVAITSISFIDENGDGKPDMAVTIGNSTMFVLFNDGKTFTTTAPK